MKLFPNVAVEMLKNWRRTYFLLSFDCLLKRLPLFHFFHQTFIVLHAILMNAKFVEAGGRETRVKVELDGRRSLIVDGMILNLWLWLCAEWVFWYDNSIFGLTITFRFHHVFLQFSEEEEVPIVRIPTMFWDCLAVRIKFCKRFSPCLDDKQHDISCLEGQG